MTVLNIITNNIELNEKNENLNSRENENPTNDKIDGLLNKINELNLGTTTNEEIHFHYQDINKKESKENDSKKKTSSVEDSQRYFPLHVSSPSIESECEFTQN
ncbi:412_t:CDS:2, partial [Ambispora gerdemannii]